MLKIGVDKNILDSLPCYGRFGDLTIIGTNHLLDYRNDCSKKEQFLEEIAGIDHLILEGYEHSYLKPANIYNFEALAYNNRPTSTRFIEDGEDFIEANGIRRDLFGLYMTFLEIPRILNKSPTPELLISNVKKMAQILDKVYPAIDGQATFGQFMQVIVEYQDMSSLYILGQKWAHHSSRNRDHYIFGPKTVKWSKELEGNKVELVGYNHFIFLEKYLTEGVPELGHWRDTLEPEHKKIAEDIEERLFP
ncbi:MAG: hypothetical protein ABIA62_01465 [Candidatus Woesearchaeota archaeon]